MPSVLFLVLNQLSLREFISLAVALKEQGLASPTLLVKPGLAGGQVEDLARLGLDARQLPDLPAAIESYQPGGMVGGWVERLTRRLRGPAGGLSFVCRRFQARLDWEMKVARRWLDELNPETLVTLSGRKTEWEMVFVKLCRDRGTRVVVPPVAATAQADLLTQRRIAIDYLGRWHPNTRQRFPGQYRWESARGQHISYYPAYVLEVASTRGALPPQPWANGGGWSDLVLFSSYKERDQALALGIDPEQALVTGQMLHDELYNNRERRDPLRSDLARQYGLGLERGLLVAALPQLGEHNQLPWERHWQEIHFLCQHLTQSGAPCLISLHPRMDPAQYAFVHDTYGLALARQPLAEIMPAADAFLATYSSTVEWAGLLGIPALVVDFYDLNYTIFDGLPGIDVVREKGRLGPALREIIEDPEVRRNRQQGQHAWAKGLAPFDGQAGARILAAIVGTNEAG